MREGVRLMCALFNKEAYYGLKSSNATRSLAEEATILQSMFNAHSVRSFDVKSWYGLAAHAFRGLSPLVLGRVPAMPVLPRIMALRL